MEDITHKELTMTREFDAPREIVFNAWVDPEQVEKWWGPSGVTNRLDVWDVTPGGKLSLTMIAGQELGPMAGQEWPMTGEFKEIEKPSKLVFTGNAIMDGKEILQHLTTVTFEEAEGNPSMSSGHRTKMTVHIEVTNVVMPDAKMPLQGMEMGWNQQLDKLVTFIQK